MADSKYNANEKLVNLLNLGIACIYAARSSYKSVKVIFNFTSSRILTYFCLASKHDSMSLFSMGSNLWLPGKVCKFLHHGAFR